MPLAAAGSFQNVHKHRNLSAVTYLAIKYWCNCMSCCLMVVRLPPSTVRHPAAYSVYKENAALIVLECVAQGSPPPRYVWVLCYGSLLSFSASVSRMLLINCRWIFVNPNKLIWVGFEGSFPKFWATCTYFFILILLNRVKVLQISKVMLVSFYGSIVWSWGVRNFSQRWKTNFTFTFPVILSNFLS